MDEILLYIFLAIALAAIIGILTYFNKSPKSLKKEENAEPAETEEIQHGAQGVPVEGVRNRVTGNRNARARMRVAQTQRQLEESVSEGENEEELEDEIVLPDAKIGKKKLAKLQMKAEKKAMREAEEREREEKKEREELKAEKRRQLEKEREEEEAKKEEEERLRREEEERREQEEYEKMKEQFQVEEEGFDENDDNEKMKDVFREFLEHIKKNKVVVLEDLAALFKLKTQAVIDRITQLQQDECLTGVIDDRGKFIYICEEELESVAKFIRQRGRVSISDLAEASNTLINLTPETSVEA